MTEIDVHFVMNACILLNHDASLQYHGRHAEVILVNAVSANMCENPCLATFSHMFSAVLCSVIIV
jgi:hypothetical protein